jgi:DNA-binding NarL/FixJ family response regulator
MHRIRILIADDHAIVRDGLALLLDGQADMQVVGMADDGRDLVRQTQACHAELVVMDISMPHVNGIEATAQLHEQCPEVKVIALSRHSEAVYVRQLMRAGAQGYVLKRADGAELLAAIRTVVGGATYVAGSVEAPQPAQRPVRKAGQTVLSEREADVARLIARGYSNRDIATRLEISTKTIDTYKARAMEKLGMVSRAELVRYALQQGWLDET